MFNAINRELDSHQTKLNQRLLIAVKQNKTDLLKELLDCGADPNSKFSENNQPAIIRAIQYGYIKVLILLLKANVNINVVDNEGYTPLMRSMMRKNISVFNILLEYANCDINAFYHHPVYMKEKTLCTPLMFSLIRNCYENKSEDNFVSRQMMEKLLNFENINITDSFGRSALMLAAQYNNDETVLLKLIDTGADLYAVDKKGRTPLMYAVCNFKSVIPLSIFLNLDSSKDYINSIDRKNKTALMYAAANSFNPLFMISTLANINVDLTCHDVFGKSALDYACSTLAKKKLEEKIAASIFYPHMKNQAYLRKVCSLDINERIIINGEDSIIDIEFISKEDLKQKILTTDFIAEVIDHHFYKCNDSYRVGFFSGNKYSISYPVHETQWKLFFEDGTEEFITIINKSTKSLLNSLNFQERKAWLQEHADTYEEFNNCSIS